MQRDLSAQRSRPQRDQLRVRRRRVAVTITAGIIAVLLVAGCSSSHGAGTSSASGGSGSSASGSTSQAVTPKTGGKVTMLMNGLSATLDPATNQLYSFTDGPVMSAIYGNLVYLDPQTGKPNYSLLKTMTPNADFSVWTMTLNPNIKFSDGTPLDASAIMFNYQRIADPATASFYGPLAKTFTMKVIDDLNLQITLPAPNAYLPAIIAEDLGAIGSPTAIQSEGKSYGTHPVGAGPFTLQSLVAGETITVVRNPTYDSFKKGQPYLDSIVFQYLPDLTQQKSALASNQAQMAGPTGGGANDTLKSTGLNYYVNNTGGGQDLLFNTTAAPFNDVRARQAIAYALDRSAAADAFAVGTKAATNLFSSNSPYFDAQYNWPAQDKAKAQQLFDQLASEGKPVDFTYTTINSPNQTPMANYLLAALAPFKNVKVTINAEPAAQYSQDQHAGRYQVLPSGLYMIPAVPDATDTFATNGVLNSFHWNDPTSNAAIQDILRTSPNDTAQLKKDWGIVLKQVVDQVPVYFVGVGTLGLVYSKSLVNVHPINYDNYVLWGELGYSS